MPRAETYQDKPCRKCGGTEYYLKQGWCKACKVAKAAEYRENRKKPPVNQVSLRSW